MIDLYKELNLLHALNKQPMVIQAVRLLKLVRNKNVEEFRILYKIPFWSKPAYDQCITLIFLLL